MRVQVVGAACPVVGHPLSTFVFDDVLAIDAGALGWWSDPATQARVRDVLLTHVHLDHLAGLPTFLENVYRLAPEPPTIHASDAALTSLQAHLFNDVLMPDFVALSKLVHPFLKTVPVAVGRAFRVGSLDVTAIEVNHTIPTLAFVIDDGSAAVAVVTDTAPVPLVLADLARMPRLKAVFLEASFPNAMGQLAAVSKHLTSAQFLDAVALLPPTLPVFAVHVKMRFFDEVCREILSAGLPNVRIAEAGQVLVV